MLLNERPINKQALLDIQQDIQKHSPYPQKVKLIAVTKTISLENIAKEINKYFSIIGESKIQETENKIQKLNNIPEIHMIGHLQTNKVNKAVKIYQMIQTVDSIKLATKINTAAQKTNKQQNILIQINISKNSNQHGISLKEVDSTIENILKLSNINLKGIMAIATNTTRKTTITTQYRKMFDLQQRLAKTVSPKINEISMGMSQDYVLALQNGATMIRVGNKLFGTR